MNTVVRSQSNNCFTCTHWISGVNGDMIVSDCDVFEVWSSIRLEHRSLTGWDLRGHSTTDTPTCSQLSVGQGACTQRCYGHQLIYRSGSSAKSAGRVQTAGFINCSDLQLASLTTIDNIVAEQKHCKRHRGRTEVIWTNSTIVRCVSKKLPIETCACNKYYFLFYR